MISKGEYSEVKLFYVGENMGAVIHGGGGVWEPRQTGRYSIAMPWTRVNGD